MNLQDYVDQNRLSKKTKGDLSLYCYTKEEFFDKTNWDQVTLTHRGKLYCKDRAVNMPFRKIFNLNEHEETQEDRIQNLLEFEPFVVLDKCNGHVLCILFLR